MPRVPAPVASLALILALAFALPSQVVAQAVDAPPAGASKAKANDRSKAKAPRRPHRDSGRTYMGRPIADVMSYQAADWLFRPEREEEEHTEQMLDALKIRPGDVVADVGAGAGYMSLRLAGRVGPTGKVLATDIQQEMIRMLNANARAAGIGNIQAIRCTTSDPNLPAGEVDLALMVDVYHECSQPRATLKGLRKALKPGGRLVLVEFRAEDPRVPIKPEHKMALAQVRREVEPEGFAFKESLEFLPWQHLIIFEKPAEERGEKQAAEKEKPTPPAASPPG